MANSIFDDSTNPVDKPDSGLPNIWLKQAKFRSLLYKKPTWRDVLCAKDFSPVKVVWSTSPEGDEIAYVNAVVDDEATGWFLKTGNEGLKCIFDKPSIDFLRQKFPNRTNATVVAIRVLRLGLTRRSLICEIVDEHSNVLN